MKRAGIINANLAGALSRPGHTDLVVRTGGATPYSNSVLRSGVPF
jgi:D-ribose pyranose/furanose isomerase RbsD